MSFQYSEELPSEDKRRYFEKLNLVGLTDCPYKLPGDCWKNEPKEWPAIEYGHVYTYLIKSPRLYSTEMMENYKSLDAHAFFLSGWVQTIEHVTSSTGLLVFRADVKPSYRVTEEPHHPWVVLKPTGQVVAGHCDCTAGCGETCSHVGAVLFKMEAGVRLGFTTTACTDTACVWNQSFVKNVNPDKVADIKFYKAAAKEKCIKSRKIKKPTPPPATVNQQEQFLSSLATSDKKVVGLSTFASYAHLFSDRGPVPVSRRLPKPMATLYKADNEALTQQQMLDLCDATNIQVSAAEVEQVEEATRGQSSSKIWHEQRHGRITASVAGECLRTNVHSPAPSLLKRICGRKVAQIKVPPIVWGNEHEEDAFRLFSRVLGEVGPHPKTAPTGTTFLVDQDVTSHDKLEVGKSGFVICEERPHLGASPDGIASCGCCGKGVLEIKCPYKHRLVPLSSALADREFCLDTARRLKKNHAYYAQIQMEMYVCGVQHGFFVVWTPIDCAIIRIARDQDFIHKMIQTLDVLWKTAVLPELLTRKIENTAQPSASTSAQPSAATSAQPSAATSTSPSKTILYCLCKTSTNLEGMVGCDQCDNWFHLNCLKLKRFPTTRKWYCKTCRKQQRKL